MAKPVPLPSTALVAKASAYAMRLLRSHMDTWKPWGEAVGAVTMSSVMISPVTSENTHTHNTRNPAIIMSLPVSRLIQMMRLMRH